MWEAIAALYRRWRWRRRSEASREAALIWNRLPETTRAEILEELRDAAGELPAKRRWANWWTKITLNVHWGHTRLRRVLSDAQFRMMVRLHTYLGRRNVEWDSWWTRLLRIIDQRYWK